MQSDRTLTIIWADKLALVIASAISLYLALAWGLAYLIVGRGAAVHLWTYMGARSFALALLGVAALWLVARGIHGLLRALYADSDAERPLPAPHFGPAPSI